MKINYKDLETYSEEILLKGGFDAEESAKDATYDNMVEDVFANKLISTYLCGGMVGMTERYSPIAVEDICFQQNIGDRKNNRMLGTVRDNFPRLETHGTKDDIKGVDEVATGIPDKYMVSRNDIHFFER